MHMQGTGEVETRPPDFMTSVSRGSLLSKGFQPKPIGAMSPNLATVVDLDVDRAPKSPQLVVSSSFGKPPNPEYERIFYLFLTRANE